MNLARETTWAALLAGGAFLQTLGASLQPWLGASLLAAIALVLVGQVSWPRLRRALLRGLAEEADELRSRPASSNEPAAPQVQIVLEDGPEFTRSARFQVRIVDPTGQRVDPARTRAFLEKTRGPECPVPVPQTSLVAGSRPDELVLDGRIAFEADRDGRQLGEWALVVESGRGARTGRARRRLFVVHAIDPARPASQTFERSSDWSTTAALELRGEGPADGRFGEAVLRQRFTLDAGLGVRGRVRYRLHDPAGSGELEIAWGPELAARLRLGTGPGAGIGAPGGSGGVGDLRELLIPTADEDGTGELEIAFQLERTADGACATLAVDGLTAASRTLHAIPGGDRPLRLALRVRNLTAFAEDWRVAAA